MVTSGADSHRTFATRSFVATASGIKTCPRHTFDTSTFLIPEAKATKEGGRVGPVRIGSQLTTSTMQSVGACDQGVDVGVVAGGAGAVRPALGAVVFTQQVGGERVVGAALA